MPRFLKLALLVLFAAIGAVVFRALFVAASQPGPARAPEVDRVRVAAADLPEGMLLRDSDLAWKDMPHKQVPQGALVNDNKGDALAADLKGDVLRHAVTAGAPLGTADVITPDAPGFLAAALKPGMRAISVAIDDVSGNAGLIQPGDYVDVLLTRQLGDSGREQQNDPRAVESETVVNRVRVLAVGSIFQRPKSEAPDANTRARTVTFEVTAHTAQVVAVASHLGSLSLALRSFATSDRNPPAVGLETPPQTPPVWAGDVSRAMLPIRATERGRAERVTASPHPVIVYRGSKVSDASGDTRSTGSTGVAGLPPLPPNPPATVAEQSPLHEQPTAQR
ncbi:Flp pilus assembly protein CpaB [Paraburkholderia sp. MPAMCS5]|uniref:Flp pilus assembly protein CpaB n=1 Tax=Paraburkholderia sp. MPAMCS5 TaxID=3112563 RepID=UPI002E16C4DB|nr:Flp pilus assembly protein CpaB [Paraburkholderia sp. MPAMCS5]